MDNINIEIEDDYYDSFLEEDSPRTNYGEGYYTDYNINKEDEIT